MNCRITVQKAVVRQMYFMQQKFARTGENMIEKIREMYRYKIKRLLNAMTYRTHQGVLQITIKVKCNTPFLSVRNLSDFRF